MMAKDNLPTEKQFQVASGHLLVARDCAIVAIMSDGVAPLTAHDAKERSIANLQMAAQALGFTVVRPN